MRARTVVVGIALGFAAGALVSPIAASVGQHQFGLANEISRSDPWGGDRTVPDRVADSMDPVMGGEDPDSLWSVLRLPRSRK